MNTPLPPSPQMPFVETPTNEKARLSLILGLVSLFAGRFLPFLFKFFVLAYIASVVQYVALVLYVIFI